MRLLSGLHELVFPAHCFGCGLLNADLCSRCKNLFHLINYQSKVGSVPVFSSVNYNPVARRILLAAKEDGVHAADDLLVSALHHSFLSAISVTGKHPILVPIPSSAKAVRKRGRDFVLEISQRLSGLVGLPTRNLLHHNRSVRDQSLLDASARFKNLDGAITLTRPPTRLHGIILIDDLVTTGATLNEAVRTLEMSGFRVAGAVTALVSLPLR